MLTETTFAVQIFDVTRFGVAPGARIECETGMAALAAAAALSPKPAGAAAIQTNRMDGRVQEVVILGRWGAVPDDYMAAFIARPY